MPEPYRLAFARSAQRELEKIPRRDLHRITQRIQSLAADPRPPGCQKIVGADFYRIRQGDYRVFYAVDDGQRLIDIIKIGHRREVYR